MRSKVKDNIEDLTQATCELLYKTNYLKQQTKEAMVNGEIGYIKGITVVEETILELNPLKIDEEVIETIIKLSEAYIAAYEEERQHVDKNMRLGAMQCYSAIDIYYKGKKRELVNF